MEVLPSQTVTVPHSLPVATTLGLIFEFHKARKATIRRFG
jgi:hypothetical protein